MTDEHDERLNALADVTQALHSIVRARLLKPTVDPRADAGRGLVNDTLRAHCAALVDTFSAAVQSPQRNKDPVRSMID